jgi:hypothetical protein
MPYYVYRIESKPFKKLDKLNAFESFREASSHAKEARAGVAPDIQIKVIFAENELQAEDLLNTVRQAQITGNDD